MDVSETAFGAFNNFNMTLNNAINRLYSEIRDEGDMQLYNDALQDITKFQQTSNAFVQLLKHVVAYNNIKNRNHININNNNNIRNVMLPSYSLRGSSSVSIQHDPADINNISYSLKARGVNDDESNYRGINHSYNSDQRLMIIDNDEKKDFIVPSLPPSVCNSINNNYDIDEFNNDTEDDDDDDDEDDDINYIPKRYMVNNNNKNNYITNGNSNNNDDDDDNDDNDNDNDDEKWDFEPTMKFDISYNFQSNPGERVEFKYDRVYQDFQNKKWDVAEKNIDSVVKIIEFKNSNENKKIIPILKTKDDKQKLLLNDCNANANGSGNCNTGGINTSSMMSGLGSLLYSKNVQNSKPQSSSACCPPPHPPPSPSPSPQLQSQPLLNDLNNIRLLENKKRASSFINDDINSVNQPLLTNNVKFSTPDGRKVSFIKYDLPKIQKYIKHPFEYSKVFKQEGYNNNNNDDDDDDDEGVETKIKENDNNQNNDQQQPQYVNDINDVNDNAKNRQQINITINLNGYNNDQNKDHLGKANKNKK